MSDPVIAEHAFKHGLNADDIAYAWENFIRKQYRGSPHEGEIVVVGCDRKGRFVELVAVERPFGIVIYHAMQPPTVSVLVELGLVRRGQ